MEDSKVLRRRKSVGEMVLERNLCFIDTPGIIDFESTQNTSDGVIHFVERLLRSNAGMSLLSDGDLLSILSGNGGVQVDLIIYVFSSMPFSLRRSSIR